MQYIVLPGFSLRNKEWAYELQTEMQPRGYNFQVFEWYHWQTDNSADFSVENEVKRLREVVDIDDFTIVAKSIGTLITCAFITLESRYAEQYVFFGIPIHDITRQYERKFFESAGPYLSNLTVIQNEFDNHGSYTEVEQFLAEYAIAANMIKTAGSDHNYPYYDQLQEVLG